VRALAGADEPHSGPTNARRQGALRSAAVSLDEVLQKLPANNCAVGRFFKLTPGYAFR